MDRHSEVEIKFRAPKVSLQDYHKLLLERDTVHTSIKGIRQHFRIARYKVARGSDTFFNLGGEIVRYRSDGGGGVLTYKKRKSDKSIMDRVEIDLPFADSVQPRDVHKVMRFLGAEEEFEIFKISYIYHAKGEYEGAEYEATFALYDVFTEGEEGPFQRFLEVEIERDNKCSPDDAIKILDKWSKIIKTRLEVEGPLNESLYEIYSKNKVSK